MSAARAPNRSRVRRKKIHPVAAKRAMNGRRAPTLRRAPRGEMGDPLVQRADGRNRTGSTCERSQGYSSRRSPVRAARLAASIAPRTRRDHDRSPAAAASRPRLIWSGRGNSTGGPCLRPGHELVERGPELAAGRRRARSKSRAARLRSRSFGLTSCLAANLSAAAVSVTRSAPDAMISVGVASPPGKFGSSNRPHSAECGMRPADCRAAETEMRRGFARVWRCGRIGPGRS